MSCPFIFIGTFRNHHCNEGCIIIGTIAALAENVGTCDSHICRHCVNNDSIASHRILTGVVLIGSFHCENVRAGGRQGCHIESVGHTGNQCAVHIPFICRLTQFCIRFILISDRQRSHTIQTNIFRGAFQCQFNQIRSNIEGILIRDKFECSGISIACEILINRDDFILVTADRVRNSEIVYISSINCCRSFFLPFPHIGLFGARGIGVSCNHNRGGVFTEERYVNQSNRSRRNGEIVNRRIFAIAAGTCDLDIEFVRKRIRQARERVHEETVGWTCCTDDVLAITSPLVGSFNRIVFQLSGKCNHIILASVVRTDDVHNSACIYCDDHIVGCVGVVGISRDTAGNGILSCSITTKSERVSCGVGRMVVHQPDTTCNRLATAILIIAHAEHSLIMRACQTQALRLRWGYPDDRISIHGFGIHQKSRSRWRYPTVQINIRIVEMRCFTASLACS